MRILHIVESYLPSRHGMQEVVTRLSESMAAKGHNVTVATRYDPARKTDLINNVKVIGFKVRGNMVYGIEGEKEKYQDYILNNKFDIITCFAAQQWATDLVLPLLDKIDSRKVFVPTGFSGYYNKDYQQYFEQMKDWMKKFDMNIFLSDDYRDINFARQNAVKNVMLIPNGASHAEFSSNDSLDIRKELKISHDTKLILHVGSYTGIKGHKQALDIFLKSNIRNAVLLMIGDNDEFVAQHLSDTKFKYFTLHKQKLFYQKKIMVKKLPRNWTVAAFKSADIFLFPSQLECSPIVLFESMAARTPFLTTNVGNSKEIISWSDAGYLLPTTTDNQGYGHADLNKSAKMLEKLVNNKDECVKLGNNGYNAWKQRFTWEKIGESYENLYSNLLINRALTEKPSAS